MTNKEIIEVLALLNKVKIEYDPTLTKDERELWESFVDEIKKWAQ